MICNLAGYNEFFTVIFTLKDFVNHTFSDLCYNHLLYGYVPPQNNRFRDVSHGMASAGLTGV